MKKISKFVKLGLLYLSVPLFASCGFVKSKDNGIVIKSLTYEVLESGDIVITIAYNNKGKDNDVFTIPKGEIGEEGNGILSIEPTGFDPETGMTTITVTFTDPGVPAKTFTVPAGRGIKKVHSSMDDSGNIVIIFEFTDGTFSEKHTIPKGETGVGINDYETIANIDGSIDLILHLSNETDVEVHIPSPEKGNGIDHIVSGETESQYYLTVYYTDVDEGGNNLFETIYFDKPIINTWIEVTEKPSVNIGRIGDFAFDTLHKIIYEKVLNEETGEVEWKEIIKLRSDETTWTVTFDLNDDTHLAQYVTGKEEYTIKNGQTFYSSSYQLPLATRLGYDFCGWSTSKTPNVTNGLFTDLTPVMSDMVLYAVWID